jgi:hypothetical protein
MGSAGPRRASVWRVRRDEGLHVRQDQRGSSVVWRVAAGILAAESLVFIWVHVQYGEIPPIILSGVLGLLMAFIAYGRAVLNPF